MPLNQAIKIYRGEDVIITFTMSPIIDITGWSILMTITKKFNTTTKILTIPGTVLSGPDGQFYVPLTSIQTDINPEVYKYDVFRNLPDDNRVLSIGDFIVAKDSRYPE